ncbi:M48 family metalloprotease [Flammeovirga sp. SubArs3]|uniref:M48 family metalloprotease n=1 Tax=Flammeovirga sp. SubArs3 TaxID=2995316 RepID=UPI00248AE371|nr:M48 family metalloprotease [Flammeovirga sp. SubArs3]
MKAILSLLYTLVFHLSIQNMGIAQSIELDKSIGREYANKVIHEIGVYQDKALTDYINSVGQHLVDQLENKQFDYEFRIVPEVEPNAFALPGGYVFITTGLLSIIQTEDELAGILSHEIIHAHNRHSIAQMKKGILPKLLELPGDLLGVINKDLGTFFNAPIRSTNALYMASYGRKKETEADLEGMELSLKAGYNPESLKDILHRMTEVVALITGESESKSYFNDHPYTPDRESKISLQASFMIQNKDYHNKKNYHTQIDGLLFGRSATYGVFNGNIFMHPTLSIKVELPDQWLLVNEKEFVGAYSQNQKEGIVITLEKDQNDVMESVLAFSDKLTDKEKTCIVDKGYFSHHEKDGYSLSFKSSDKSNESYVHLGWVSVNNRIYKISNFSSSPAKEVFMDVITSLGDLTSEEKLSIQTQKIAIVKVKKGETLEQLCQRTNNSFQLLLIGFLNDKKREQTLVEGENIKVIQKYPYTTETSIDYTVRIAE